MNGIQYLQLELRGTAETRMPIAPNQSLPFDEEIDGSGPSDISYEPENDLLPLEGGKIIFHRPGVFFVNWFVAQQTGLAPSGANFALVMSVPDGPSSSIIGSGHTKISASSGFAVLMVPKAETELRLKNVAGSKATLSERTSVKAGIAIFSLTPEAPAVMSLGYGHAQIVEPDPLYPHQLELEDQGGGVFSAAIPFDEAIKFDPDGIVTYLDETFTLSRVGTYLVTWEIPIEATDEGDEVFIDLMFNDSLHSSSYSPLPIGVVSGSALLVTADEDETVQLRLRHNFGEIVHIGEHANVVITQISNLEADEEEPDPEP